MMGREIRRVPAGFEFPEWETWPGCLGEDPFPDPVPCDACSHSGENPVRRSISESFYPHMVGGNGAAAWSLHVCQADVDALIRKDRRPEGSTVATVNDNMGLGFDSIDRWIMGDDRYRRLTGGDDSGNCPDCEGHGDHDPHREERDAWWDQWEPTYPEGDWYQLWQTVSEGGPVSPAFETAEELAEWMSTNKATVMGPVPYDDALRWIHGPGWAPTIILDSRGLSDGVRS